jgi:hypothetical protein
LRGLGLRDPLLRQQQEREEPRTAHAWHPRKRRELGRDLLESAAGNQPRVGPLPRRAEADRRGLPVGRAVGGAELQQMLVQKLSAVPEAVMKEYLAYTGLKPDE